MIFEGMLVYSGHPLWTTIPDHGLYGEKKFFFQKNCDLKKIENMVGSGSVRNAQKISFQEKNFRGPRKTGVLKKNRVFFKKTLFF